MSRYRRRVLYWPVGLLVLVVGLRGRSRSQPSSSGQVHRPEQLHSQPPELLASTPSLQLVRHTADHKLPLKVIGVHSGDRITGPDESTAQHTSCFDAT